MADHSDIFDYTGTLKAEGDPDFIWDQDDDSSEDPHADGSYAYFPDSAPADNYKSFALIYQTACDTDDQYCKIHLQSLGDDDSSIGALFRGSGATASTAAFYACAIRWSGSAYQFSVEIYSSGRTYVDVVGTRENITKPGATNWIGFSVTGSDPDTVWKFWEWPSDPGDYADWGTDDSGSGNQYKTNTSDPDPGDEIDTGKYVGIWHYQADANNEKQLNAWYAGDQAAAGVTVPDQTLAPNIQLIGSGGMIGGINL